MQALLDVPEELRIAKVQIGKANAGLRLSKAMVGLYQLVSVIRLKFDFLILVLKMFNATARVTPRQRVTTARAKP